MNNKAITFSQLEKYHNAISKVLEEDYSSTEVDLPPLPKLKKLCYSAISSSPKFSAVCVSILADVLRLSTQNNNFTNHEITVFFTNLFSQLQDKDNEAEYFFAKYSISKVIECDAILLVLQLKSSSTIIEHIYDLKESDVDIGVSLLNCLIREDAISDDKDNQNWLDIYGKEFMNKVIYNNEICNRLILENLRLFEEFIVRFYNDFILANDGTFDLQSSKFDGDVLDQINSFKHKGFIKLDKLNNLYLKLYCLNKSLLNNWFIFLQREILSDNKFVRIIAIKMIKNFINSDQSFPHNNESLFKLLLLRSKDAEPLVRMELFKSFDKLFSNVSSENENYQSLLLKNVELGLLDVNWEIRLEVVSFLPNILDKVSHKITTILAQLCRDKNQSIRVKCCVCLCNLLVNNHQISDASFIAKSLLNLYYINDYNINIKLDEFFPEYIQFDLQKLNHLVELVQDDQKAIFCLLSLFSRYKSFNKYLLDYLDNVLSSNENDEENTKIVSWFGKHFNEMSFFTDKISYDVAAKLRPLITGRLPLWEDGNFVNFIEYLKKEENINDDTILNNFKLLIFRSTNSLLNIDQLYTYLHSSTGIKRLDSLIEMILNNKNCLQSLDVDALAKIFVTNLRKSNEFDENLKKLYLMHISVDSFALEIDDGIKEIMLDVVKKNPNSLNSFIISEIMPSLLSTLLIEINLQSENDISITQLNLLSQNVKQYGVLIDELIPKYLTTELLEEEEEVDDDSELKIPQLFSLFSSQTNYDLIKSLILLKAKGNGNNSFTFFKSLLETQGNCIISARNPQNWWRLCIMQELIEVYVSKAVNPLYYEEFLGETQAAIQWFAIDSNKFVRKLFLNFIMKNFASLPMSMTFFIFFASEEEDEDDIDDYTQFITISTKKHKFTEEKYFERLTSRFIHNLSYLPSLATIDDNEMDRMDVIRDVVDKLIFFLQFVLNKDNCNLVLTYSNLIFSYYDKLNAENDCLYLVADICINVITNVIKQRGWVDLKIINEDVNSRMKLPLDLFVKKENTKKNLLGSVKEYLNANEKEEIMKMAVKNRFLGAAHTSHPHADIRRDLTASNITMSARVSTKKRKEVFQDQSLHSNLRKSKRAKREVNYDENDSIY